MDRFKKYWDKQKEIVSDKWAIKCIMSDKRLSGAAIKRSDITQGMIEKKKETILISRLKKSIEVISDKGVCGKCKALVPLSEFKKTKKTTTHRSYLIRICQKCKNK
jgi:hypothetical protein